MDVIHTLWQALWHHDIAMLTNPSLVWTLYGILFTILLLENGVLPAAFLPGDSLLLLVGVLVAKGAINYPLAVVILTAGASIGSWIGFLQGHWLGNTKVVQNWLSHIPSHYHQRAHNLFHRHGLAALFIGRFLAFVRTLLPTLAGISGLNSGRFQFFNWMSGFLWVVILTSLGYALGSTKTFDRYENELMKGLVLLPIVLLVLGLVGSIIVIWRKKRESKANKSE
ncbi:DedA family protein [Pragia fontium]|uniref:Membrane protein DedA, SNARE-associated domain n=2 Tax=Pragia fontium TaxID=82985 RepID=A0AAJ5BGT7_9GAMM|nr:DedA family protein [Pragia fontium]AKJ43219.1 membrane protein [Pragia fontium]SFC62537.1 membrane protein DedA, SNARE-associated domain [Pragia fontium DSM 5563 = ATCC 49100]SUB83662.1 Inner membrane protein YqjA [Pragia fontium]VEJ56567.1 Inner membrane protein YqjA [Pragia fontium]GKX64017.1 membrane protein [Pragia fontium]